MMRKFKFGKFVMTKTHRVESAKSHFENRSFFFFNFYCYSITVVCLFSPSLHPTPAEPTSLPHLHPPPWICPCVLYSSSKQIFLMSKFMFVLLPKMLHRIAGFRIGKDLGVHNFSGPEITKLVSGNIESRIFYLLFKYVFQ